MYRPFLLVALRRPRLWPALLSGAWAFRSKDWYRKAPFLPLPSKAYMRWRLETAYGEPDAVPPADEIARFVTWSAEMRRRMRPDRRVPLAVKLLLIVGLAAFMVWVNLRAGDVEGALDAAAAAGYPGLFAVSVVSGFNVVWPVPVAWFYPFLIEAGFGPVPTLATIAVGMTGGDLLGYLIGNTTRNISSYRLARFRVRAEAWHARHRFLPLALLFLYAAFVPLPNELLVIPMAYMRYSMAAVMAAVLFGNVIFNTLMAMGVSLIFGAGG
ncbi:MAG: hypothetical protein F4139_15665 [Gemmatimonadetes bacterium]|nr:hypothetical protein [Gemmatimonadota bacterium]MYA64615.1 hypothetical protein [Gemmatimonadota bacterium]MYB97365.1 hypothetical protein [Gemmatimonadota bacterium]MYH54351.1 hypothetical protein [Gemmatimonadota bacterium]MYI44917.1 hypothetical protein [Gemmatimonadota bacterium]